MGGVSNGLASPIFVVMLCGWKGNVRSRCVDVAAGKLPCSGGSRFGAVTPRLFATFAFPPTRNTNSSASRLFGLYFSLQSRLTAHDGSVASRQATTAKPEQAHFLNRHTR